MRRRRPHLSPNLGRQSRSSQLASTRPLARFSLRWSRDEISCWRPQPERRLILQGIVIQNRSCSTVYRKCRAGCPYGSCSHFAAWIGLVPKQYSTGGKERLGGISKRGDTYLRKLEL